MNSLDRVADATHARLVVAAAPGPGVAEPQRRQDVHLGRLGPAIVDRNLDQNIFRPILGVFDEDVEVAVVVEDAGVEQLVLELIPAAAAVGVNQIGVRELPLRILIEVLHVRMGRRAVEIEVVFLDVLAVVTLAVGQAEKAIFENWVLAVPESQRETETLLVVGDAGQAVLAPAIGAGARLIVAEVVPGVTAFAVIFADGPPLALAQVGTPLFPRCVVGARFVEP